MMRSAVRPSRLPSWLRTNPKTRQLQRARCCRGSGERLPSRSYNSEDGKSKTTFEEVFGPAAAKNALGVAAPWELGWQMNERNVQWNDVLKMRLIKTFAADELRITEAECEARLQTLVAVVPGIEPRIQNMPKDLIVQLLHHTNTLASTLVTLKSIFPRADVASVLISQPSLAAKESLDQVAASAAELRMLLPRSNVDQMVERFPMLLDIEQLKEAIKDLEVLMPGSNFEEVLQKNPQLIFSLQKGKNMIPYDEVPTAF